MQHQTVVLAGDEASQLTLLVKPENLLRIEQLLEPVVIAQVSSGLGQIEVAMKAAMYERTVTDRQRQVCIDSA